MTEPNSSRPDLRIPADAICDAAPDGLVIVDGDGLITWVNLELEQLTGYSAAELVGQSIEHLVPDDQRSRHVELRKAYVASPTKRPMGVGLQLSARRRDGSCFPAHISLSTISSASGQMVLASVRDVSDWVEAERQLAESERRRAVAEDQERIARDLHDTVIQELFSIGLGLQALQVRVDQPDVAERIAAAIDQIDDTIREVRTAIFDLHQQAAAGTGMHDAIIDVTDGLSRSLGFEPKVVIEGPLDHSVPDDVWVHLVPTVREALTNVARHAGASWAQVCIVVDDHLTLEVTDDGCGVGPNTDRRSGLDNLAARAALLGGDFTIEGADAGGTRLHWQVPLTRASSS